MNAIHDYESWGCLNFSLAQPELLETFSGKSIVTWHGKIEGQLVNMLDEAEKGRNFPYADKIREFLKIWRGNEITGSINREQLETLKAAADMLSVDSWNLATYFRSLRDRLRELIASEEELPRDIDMNQNDPYAGTGGGGHGAPPMSPSFGPEGGAPGGPEGPGGPGGVSASPGGTTPGSPGGEGEPLPPEGTEGQPTGPGNPEETEKDKERFGEL